MMLMHDSEPPFVHSGRNFDCKIVSARRITALTTISGRGLHDEYVLQ